MSRKSVWAMSLLWLAGCSSSPPKQTVPAAAASPSQAATTAASSDSGLDPRVIDALKRQGYVIKKSHGQDLFCRTDAIVGSHIASTTTCLTARQAQAETERAQRAMDDLNHDTPIKPPGG